LGLISTDSGKTELRVRACEDFSCIKPLRKSAGKSDRRQLRHCLQSVAFNQHIVPIFQQQHVSATATTTVAAEATTTCARGRATTGGTS